MYVLPAWRKHIRDRILWHVNGDMTLVRTLARPLGSAGPRCGGVGRVGCLSVVRVYGENGNGTGDGEV
jgi:hypothetical protein